MFRVLVVGMMAFYIKTASTSYQRQQQEQHPPVKDLRLLGEYVNGLSDDPEKVFILSPLQRFLNRANTHKRIPTRRFSGMPDFSKVMNKFSSSFFTRKRSNHDLDITDWIMDGGEKNKKDEKPTIVYQESNSLDETEKPDSGIDSVVQKRPFDSISHSTVFDLFSKRINDLKWKPNRPAY